MKKQRLKEPKHSNAATQPHDLSGQTDPRAGGPVPRDWLHEVSFYSSDLPNQYFISHKVIKQVGDKSLSSHMICLNP